MKKPVLEVIRFDEADIITSSGMGFTADYFGNETENDGLFSFFGGTGSVTSVKTEADYDGVLDAFNSYFGGGWSSTGEIYVVGDFGFIPVEGLIDKDSVADDLENQDYIGTYYYTFDGSSYYFRSH